MFKAVNNQDGKYIIILDPEWANKVEYLRSLDRRNILVCQKCKQAVRVRAGQERSWHFAHKHLKDCPLQSESPTILAARASLYRWLISKFSTSSVTLEKELLGQDFLPRPVDCWVETKSLRLAYWIVESQIKPQQREELKDGYKRLSIQVNWVFLSNMLNESEEKSERILLSTTERGLIHKSEYDYIDQSFQVRNPGFSLHYLDPESEVLTTFRGLKLVHSPQLYTGRRLAHHISEILVLGQTTGEFIHPGEYEQMQTWKQEKAEYDRKLAEEEKRRQEEEEKRRQQWLEEQRRWSENLRNLGESLENPFRYTKQKYPVTIHSTDYGQGYVQATPPPVQEAVCELCGNVTTEWYAYDNKTKKCKCMDCYRRLSQQS